MSNNREALPLFRKILLASATLPGIFPPVRIQVRVGGQNYDELHVNGGVTGRSLSRHRFFHMSLIIKNQIQRGRDFTLSEAAKSIPNGSPLVRICYRLRSVQSLTLIKNQGIGDLYRIYSITNQDGIDFNLASIPSDFGGTSDEPFDQRYMIVLFDRGHDVGSHNYRWAKAPPGSELTTQAYN